MELEMAGVTKRYKDKTAIDGFSAALGAGVYGLLGPNGAGKTTLLRMVCGLVRPDAGTVCYGGRPIRQLGEDYRKVLGYLPQNFGYYPAFTVQRYMEYLASLKGLNPRFARRRTDELLETVGLEQQRKRKIGTLSGGMRQRLGIAQALLNEPDVLILDEPTVGLDPAERVRFRNLISEVSQGKITLLSTHIVSDVSYMADEILLLQEGRLCCRGNLERLTVGVAGRVWEVLVENRQAAAIAAQFTVSSMHHTPRGAVLRIVCGERPLPQARAAAPTLEDAYLFYTGEKGGEEHAV